MLKIFIWVFFYCGILLENSSAGERPITVIETVNDCSNNGYEYYPQKLLSKYPEMLYGFNSIKDKEGCRNSVLNEDGVLDENGVFDELKSLVTGCHGLTETLTSGRVITATCHEILKMFAILYSDKSAFRYALSGMSVGRTVFLGSAAFIQNSNERKILDMLKKGDRDKINTNDLMLAKLNISKVKEELRSFTNKIRIEDLNLSEQEKANLENLKNFEQIIFKSLKVSKAHKVFKVAGSMISLFLSFVTDIVVWTAKMDSTLSKAFCGTVSSFDIFLAQFDFDKKFIMRDYALCSAIIYIYDHFLKKMHSKGSSSSNALESETVNLSFPEGNEATYSKGSNPSNALESESVDLSCPEGNEVTYAICQKNDEIV